MNWYLMVLKKYFVFNGRARRKEYWMFFLFNMIVTMVISFIEGLLGMDGAVTGLYGIAVLIPAIAVGVRRLHDIGKSGWWMLISLVPIVGPFVFLYFTVKAGDEGSNEYGGDPKLELEPN